MRILTKSKESKTTKLRTYRNCLSWKYLALIPAYFDLIRNVSGQCLDDPLCNLTTIETIRYYDYPGEEHHVQTKDGYILGLQRIPFGRDDSPSNDDPERPAVLILHGLLSSSNYYVTNGPGYALGFVLAEAGFDVWLGNDRSNVYSRKNIHYSPEDPRFWRFSGDDIFLTDVPAMIDYVISQKRTERQIFLIGYSMGTTSSLACLSGRLSYNQKVKKLILMAPTLMTNGNPSPVPLLLEAFSKLFLDTFAPTEAIFPTPESYVEAKRNHFCQRFPTFLICPFVDQDFSGSHYINQSWIPVYMSRYPAGSSAYVMDHFSRIMRAGKLVNYAFESAPRGNDSLDNSSLSVSGSGYNLEGITVPVTLFYSKADGFVSLADVGYIREQLGSNVEAHYVIEDFKHADFAYSRRAKEIVYDRIIRTFRNEI